MKLDHFNAKVQNILKGHFINPLLHNFEKWPNIL